MIAQPEYTFHVGEKFNADGTPRSYPGSTVICFTPPDSPIYRIGAALQDELRARPYGHKFGFLPPSSFHMTVFSLICDQRRDPAEWSAALPIDAPLVETDRHFIETVTPIAPPPNFRMIMNFINGWGYSLVLSPADETTFFALRTYRNQLSRATGVRYPDHDTYVFHMTLAYVLIALTPDEALDYLAWRTARGDALRNQIGVFETGAPVLTFFEDMFAFVPVDQRHTLPSRAAAR